MNDEPNAVTAAADLAISRDFRHRVAEPLRRRYLRGPVFELSRQRAGGGLLIYARILDVRRVAG